MEGRRGRPGMTGPRAKNLGGPNRDVPVIREWGGELRQSWCVLGVLSLSIPCDIEEARRHDRVGAVAERIRVEGKKKGKQEKDAEE